MEKRSKTEKNSPEDYEKCELLGKGSFGQAYSVLRKKDKVHKHTHILA
jgi:hypothetical protein